MAAGSEWLGKIRGHVSEARGRFEEDRKEREAAGKAPKEVNIILTEREVRGDWDASRVLFTTLGGTVRPIRPGDLAAFRQNMRIFERVVGKKNQGITPRQVIDLASGRALFYDNPEANRGAQSDIDKAKREITQCVPVSALNDTLRFVTNAGIDSKVQRHNVVVKMFAFDQAAAKMAAAPLGDTAAPRRVANWLRKQKIAFDCDCERHRYFFRYLASIGGFAAGRLETGYPKIRNPELVGVACKHVLRVMAELESGTATLGFLTRHLEKVNERKSRTQMRQKDAEDILKNKKRPTAIKTSSQRQAEAVRRRESRAARRALQVKRKAPPRRKAPASRRIATKREELEAFMKKSGLSREDILKMLQG